MSDTTKPAGNGKPRSWLAFAIGVAVGVALSGLVVAKVLAEQRRARRVLPWSRHRASRTAPLQAAAAAATEDGAPPEPWDEGGMPAARHWPDEAELDEELEQTFPASDPLPYSHRVD